MAKKKRLPSDEERIAESIEQIKSGSKGTIYLLNDYSAKHHDTKSGPISQIIERLEKAGYAVHHETTKEAAERLSKGENIIKGKVGYIISGSDKSFEDLGYTDKQGRRIVKRKSIEKQSDPHYALINSELPGIHICAATDHHAAMEDLNYKITRDEPNRKVIDGKHFSQRYGIKREDIPKKDIGTKIHDVETFTHPVSETEYVASFTTYGGKNNDVPKISYKHHIERDKDTKLEDTLNRITQKQHKATK